MLAMNIHMSQAQSTDMVWAKVQGTSPTDRILRIFVFGRTPTCEAMWNKLHQSYHDQDRNPHIDLRLLAHATGVPPQLASRMMDGRLLRIHRSTGTTYQYILQTTRGWSGILAVSLAGAWKVTSVTSRHPQSLNGMIIATPSPLEMSLWTS